MRTIPAAIALVLLSGLPAVAALPPQYQRQAELAAIIADPAIVQILGFEGISAIEFIATDRYRVKGGTCTIDVSIEDAAIEEDAGWAGPRQFIVVVGEHAC